MRFIRLQEVINDIEVYLLLSHEYLYKYKSILSTEIYKNILLMPIIYWKRQVCNQARKNLHYCNCFNQISLLGRFRLKQFSLNLSLILYSKLQDAKNLCKLCSKLHNIIIYLNGDPKLKPSKGVFFNIFFVGGFKNTQHQSDIQKKLLET